MKKCIAAVVAFVLMISLGACNSDGHDVYKEIYKRYNSMETFEAVAEVTVTNERTENVYLVRQLFAAPDKFLLEVKEPANIAGSGYVCKNGEITIKSGFGHDEEVTGWSGLTHGVLFVNDFFEEYFKSEETAVHVSKKTGDTLTVLECYLSGKNDKQFMERLWIDNKTFLPVKMETYDINKNVVVKVEFKEFIRDCQIDESEFE